MRTIAGQIQNYRFPNSGTLQPFEDLLKPVWQKQIGQGSVEMQNIDGNEHLGAKFGGDYPFPDLAVDVAVPAGSVMAVEYAMDRVVSTVSQIWSLITTENNRVRTDGLDSTYEAYGVQPDAGGPYELKSLDLSCHGTTLSTAIKGVYHVGHLLSDVPFTVTFAETITASATVPTSPSLNWHAAPPIVKVDTRKLLAEIRAIEVLAAGLPTAPFGIPLLAMGAGRVDDLLAAELTPLQGSLAVLKEVVDDMPQRLAIPGTTDNLIFHYDVVSFPQGSIASSDSGNSVEAVSPGSAIVFLGSHAPVRAARVAYLQVTGPADVKLVSTTGPHAVSALPMVHEYFAVVNDEVQSPNFHWTLATASGAVAKNVSLSSTITQQIAITFDHGGATPEGSYVLSVTEDDLYHLKDAQGKAPHAQLHIVVERTSLPTPKATPSKPISMKS